VSGCIVHEFRAPRIAIDNVRTFNARPQNVFLIVLSGTKGRDPRVMSSAK
jgi:hypothetical protein